MTTLSVFLWLLQMYGRADGQALRGDANTPIKADVCVHVPAVIQASFAVTKQSKALLAAVPVQQFRPATVYGEERHVIAWPKERPRQQTHR